MEPTSKDTKMRLNWVSKLGYGVGHVLNDLCAAMWFTYVLIFYSLVLGFNAFDAGVVMLVGQIADAAATPVIGILSDRGPKCCGINLRKRKFWYISGSLLVVITVPFLYSQCFGCTAASSTLKLVYYNFFVVLFQFGWAAAQVAHLAFVPDLTPDENERTFLLSIRNTFTVLSNISVYFVAFGVLEITNSSEGRLSPADLTKFQDIILIICGVGAVTTIFFCFTVKEASSEPLLHVDDEQQIVNEEATPATRRTFCNLFSSLCLYQVAGVYMGTRIFCNVIQSLVPLYLHETLQLDAQSIAVIPFVMYVSSFVTSLISGWLNGVCGRKITYVLGAVVCVGASLWVWFDHGYLYNTYFIYIVAVLFGGATSVLLVTALAVTADYIGDDTGNSAFLYGIMSFVDKLSCGIVIMIIQGLKKTVGQRWFYRDSLAIVCAVSAIIGTLSLLTMKAPNRVNRTQENEVTS
ncbi:major facilitator superfamily domain-containing protein 12-like isoform X2 [Rhodnius prolixus]|uniref:major facilitator superfamily domain-containing protein 12-like isoform X2 n=1 Tax=Rhodnius prolixus TaxID=13249 RepID=UPI003D18BEFF